MCEFAVRVQDLCWTCADTVREMRPNSPVQCLLIALPGLTGHQVYSVPVQF